MKELHSGFCVEQWFDITDYELVTGHVTKRNTVGPLDYFNCELKLCVFFLMSCQSKMCKSEIILFCTWFQILTRNA